MTLQLYYPVKPYRINQAFGLNPDVYKQFGLNGHNGIDLFATHGQPVYATHDGTCYPEVDSNQGNGVVIRSDVEYDYQGEKVHMKTIYWHLVKADAVVKTGQKVKAGDLIGYADSTGFSTGDHLHFGLKPQTWSEDDWMWANTQQNNGFMGAIDPMPFFNGLYAEDIAHPQYYFNIDFGFSAMGTDIKELQHRLGVSPETGFFWTKTKAAVIAFQKANNIPPTGYVGPLTRNALNLGSALINNK